MGSLKSPKFDVPLHDRLSQQSAARGTPAPNEPGAGKKGQEGVLDRAASSYLSEYVAGVQGPDGPRLDDFKATLPWADQIFRTPRDAQDMRDQMMRDLARLDAAAIGAYQARPRPPKARAEYAVEIRLGPKPYPGQADAAAQSARRELVARIGEYELEQGRWTFTQSQRPDPDSNTGNVLRCRVTMDPQSLTGRGFTSAIIDDPLATAPAPKDRTPEALATLEAWADDLHENLLGEASGRLVLTMLRQQIAQLKEEKKSV
jgi:hypothetical protein